MVIFVCTVLLHASAMADEDVAAEAIRCSALSYVLTALPDNASAQSMGMMMGHIHKVHHVHTSGATMSNGELSQARDSAARKLSALHDAEPMKVVDQYLRCNSWRAALAEYFQETGLLAASNEEVANRVVLGVPPAPETPEVPAMDRTMIANVMSNAFESWSEMDSEHQRVMRMLEQAAKDQ